MYLCACRLIFHWVLVMETDEALRVLPFQLQFDKPVASQVTFTVLQLNFKNYMSAYLNSQLNFDLQIKITEWNPEKDLLAMVTEDSKILLHRFNWQRLWTVSPGTALLLISAPSTFFLKWFICEHYYFEVVLLVIFIGMVNIIILKFQ